jgi:hypothetical protein
MGDPPGMIRTNEKRKVVLSLRGGVAIDPKSRALNCDRRGDMWEVPSEYSPSSIHWGEKFPYAVDVPGHNAESPGSIADAVGSIFTVHGCNDVTKAVGGCSTESLRPTRRWVWVSLRTLSLIAIQDSR